MSKRPVLLVVDDTPLFRELETLCLRRLGHVITAEDGASALEATRQHLPDLVLLDLSLPDLDGHLVCREIARAPATHHIPVIAVGSGSPSDHARAIESGAADVLAKPLSRDQLLRTTRRFVGMSKPLGLPRVGLEAPVRIAGAGESRLALARNVSRGGMFVESSWVPPEAELHLSFVLPEGPERRFEPTARVVWRRASREGQLPGFGVRFHALDRESARTLDDFVHERLTPSAPVDPGLIGQPGDPA